MAGVGDDGRAQSYRINGHLHLLRKFEAEDDEEDAGGVKLSLNLSMGGRFGVDPVEKKRLLRSSSIGGLATLPIFDDIIEKKDLLEKQVVAVAGVVGGGGGGGGHGSYVPLGRTVSLPVQTEEDLRRRKEMQMLRRLEAKRKRSEKQRNSSTRQLPAGKECRGEDATSTSIKSKILPPNSGRFWPGTAAAATATPACSQGSVSSSASDLDGRSVITVSGKDNAMIEAKTPTSTPRRLSSLPTSPAKEETEGMERRMIGEMPNVSTTGLGPNGRRVEGFLYRYRKGEEVSIVCVCHGTFFTPAEFVKHAGGGDVPHPLRHITVTPTTT